MSGVQTPEQRAAELLKLRAKVDQELIRLSYLLAPTRRRSKFDIPECGTESAFQRHRYQGDERCDPCWAAHAAHEQVQNAIRKLKKAAA